jgi:pimeloyl-ACP methyl ester carboxylesterase
MVVGQYVSTDDVRTYYEAYGRGETVVVLLHGGFGTVESWTMQTPALAERYRVYVPERRGHGHTSDVEGPITYETMAADTAAFLDAMGIGAAHLVGWSDGAVVGMLVALRRPELVRKLVVIGQYFNHEGEVPEFRTMLEHWRSDPPEVLHEVYDRVSPDGPEHFPVIVEKLTRMWREEPNIAFSELVGVRAPTLIMQADDDIVEVEHSAALAATLPDAQLAVVPGTSHLALREKPDLVNRLIMDFLDNNQPEKMMPLRG